MGLVRNIVVAGLLAAALLALPLVTRSPDADELSRLRYANALLQQRVQAYQQLARELQQTPDSNGTRGTDPSSAVSLTAVTTADLLAVHRIWDWKAIVTEFLRPWPAIMHNQIDSAVKACNGSSMYCQRFQVYKGTLYLTDHAAIFFDRHYAPARVLPLLETLRLHPDLPDLDLVVAAVDEPRIHSLPGDLTAWTRACKRWPGGGFSKLPPPLFSSTTNRNTFDLPWLDFAFFMPKAPHTPCPHPHPHPSLTLHPNHHFHAKGTAQRLTHHPHPHPHLP